MSDTCGKCQSFRQSDGYCFKKGAFINALSVQGCFEHRTDKLQDESEEKPRTKVCKKCGRELPLESFAWHKSGCRKGVCRECTSEALKKARAKKAASKADEPIVTVKPEAKKRRAEEIERNANKVALNANYTDEQMVALLREHGWTVTCVRTVHEEL